MKRTILLACLGLLWLASPAQAQFFSDTFTCTPGASLQDTTSTSGHAWDLHPNGIHGLVCDGSSARYGAPDVFSFAILFPVVTPPSADYYTECVLHVFTSNLEQYPGCSVRLQAASDTKYGFIYDTLVGQFVVEETTAGSGATLGTYSQALSNATDYTVRLQIVGSAIKLYIGGVERISVSDATITTAGTPGIHNYNPAATTDTTHIHFDSIASDTVTATGTPSRGLLGVGI